MSIKVVCSNKKAYYDYFVDETYEAGIVLKGTEVKSLRLGRANLRDTYARIINGEVFLVNLHISPYEQGDRFTQPDTTRTRKLLLNRREIKKLIGKTKEKGYTLIVTKIYFKDGKAKAELGLARGKKHYDKRESIKQKDMAREVSRDFKGVKLKG
jgi:SsrA-binding protein